MLLKNVAPALQIVEQHPDAGFYSTFRGTRTALTLAAGMQQALTSSGLQLGRHHADPHISSHAERGNVEASQGGVRERREGKGQPSLPNSC